MKSLWRGVANEMKKKKEKDKKNRKELIENLAIITLETIVASMFAMSICALMIFAMLGILKII